MKMLSVLLATILAACTFATPVLACDSSVPDGVSGTDLTITIPDCTINYSTVNGNDAACQTLRDMLPSVLSKLDEKGKTYTYVSKNDDANFIIHVDVTETKASDSEGNPTVVISFLTRGLGKTADGHSLFTAVGTEGNPIDAIVSTATKFTQFVDRGWTCDK